MTQRLVLVMAFMVSLAGCAGEAVAPTAPVIDPSGLFWEITLNQRAVNLSTAAPYDTFRLVATPRRLDGTPLNTPVRVTFTSEAEDQVRVSPDGLVWGLQRATGVKVSATVTDGDLTHRDTVLVNVTTNAMPPVLDRLVLEANSPDSAKWTMRGESHYPPAHLFTHTLDSLGNAIEDLVVSVESSDTVAARWESQFNLLTPRRPGPVTFYASTMAYGVARADTLEYMVGLPLAITFSPDGTVFSPANGVVTVGTGAYVVWRHPLSVPVYGITFHDPTHVAADTVFEQSFGVPSGCGASAGDIPLFGDYTTSENDFTSQVNACSRHFPVPGMYSYHSAALNASGTINVLDDSRAVALEAATWSPTLLRPAASPARSRLLPRRLSVMRQVKNTSQLMPAWP